MPGATVRGRPGSERVGLPRRPKRLPVEKLGGHGFLDHMRPTLNTPLTRMLGIDTPILLVPPGGRPSAQWHAKA